MNKGVSMNKILSSLVLTSLSLASCSSYKPLGIDGARSIAEEKFSPTALQVVRTSPFVPMKDLVWGRNPKSKGRTSVLRPDNIFAMNSVSMKQKALDELLQAYVDFFRYHKVDVTINEKATPELILQVESFASYIEDMIELKRVRDPYIDLTFLSSTRNLYGSLILNHKFIIQKASMLSGGNLISHKIVGGVPVTTIMYKNFIPSEYKKLAAAEPVPANKQNYLSSVSDKNIFRFSMESNFGIGHRKGSGLDLVLNAQLGYEKNGEFVFVYGSRYQRTGVDSFLTPDKIDYSIVSTFFKRVCNGLGTVYTPSNFFLNFPQMSLVKYTTSSGETRYKIVENQYDGEFSYSEKELEGDVALKRTYGDVVNLNCSAEEVQKYGIVKENIDAETGLNMEFAKFFLNKSMVYRFNLKRNTFMKEIVCPYASVCSEETRSADGVFKGSIRMDEELTCPTGAEATCVENIEKKMEEDFLRCPTGIEETCTDEDLEKLR